MRLLPHILYWGGVCLWRGGGGHACGQAEALTHTHTSESAFIHLHIAFVVTGKPRRVRGVHATVF